MSSLSVAYLQCRSGRQVEFKIELGENLFQVIRAEKFRISIERISTQLVAVCVQMPVDDPQVEPEIIHLVSAAELLGKAIEEAVDVAIQYKEEVVNAHYKG
jgi:diacylglycerol kinase